MSHPLITSITFFALLSVFSIFVPDVEAVNYYEAGCRYYVHKNWEKAKENFLKDIETTDRGDSYYFIGEIEKNRGNLDAALEYFEKAVARKMTPKYRNLAYWNLIVIYESKSNFPKTIKTCKYFYEVLGEASAKTKAENLINKLMWTENEDARKEYEEGLNTKSKDYMVALQHFRQAAMLDSSFLSPVFEIGMYYYSQNQYRDALNYFNQILYRIPFYGELQMLVGEIYFQDKRYAEAATSFESALEYAFIDKDMKYTIQLKTATSYYNSGQYEKAQSLLEQAISTKKGNLAPYLLLSAIQMQKNDYDGALLTLQSAYKIDSNNPEILYQLGLVYYNKNDNKAYEYFEKVYLQYRQKQKEVPSKYIKAFIATAQYYYTTKQYSRVVELTAIVPQNLRDESLMLNYARSLYMLAQYNEAIAHFTRFKLADNDLIILCRCYALINNTSKAKEIIYTNYYDTNFINKVKEDKLLKPLYKEVEKQREVSVTIQPQETKDSSTPHETSTEHTNPQ
ncbi:MAG: tetratricopeptide repeat protein [Spirochaetes bacterium]|nr:tetratricopeptide repeat protein [Spirochaetota bacterium]